MELWDHHELFPPLGVISKRTCRCQENSLTSFIFLLSSRNQSIFQNRLTITWTSSVIKYFFQCWEMRKYPIIFGPTAIPPECPLTARKEHMTPSLSLQDSILFIVLPSRTCCDNSSSLKSRAPSCANFFIDTLFMIKVTTHWRNLFRNHCRQVTPRTIICRNRYPLFLIQKNGSLRTQVFLILSENDKVCILFPRAQSCPSSLVARSYFSLFVTHTLSSLDSSLSNSSLDLNSLLNWWSSFTKLSVFRDITTKNVSSGFRNEKNYNFETILAKSCHNMNFTNWSN